MAEKRENKRKICRTRVKFGKTACEKTAFTGNLSPNGFFVRTNRPYSPGTVLHFEFQGTDGARVSVKGRVMHAKRLPPQFSVIQKSGMGIEIVGEKKGYIEFLRSMNLFEE